MTIDKDTKINLILAVGIMISLIGGVVWLTAQDVRASAIQHKVETLEKSHIKLEEKHDKQVLLLREIRDDVIVIKVKLTKGEGK